MAPDADQSHDVSSIVQLVVTQVVKCLPNMVSAPINALIDLGFKSLMESLPVLICKIVDISLSGRVGAPAPDSCALERRVAQLEGQIVALQTLLNGLGLDEDSGVEECEGVPSSLAPMTSKDEALLQMTREVALGDSDEEATQLARSWLQVQQQRVEKTEKRKSKQKQRKQKADVAEAASSSVQIRASAQ